MKPARCYMFRNSDKMPHADAETWAAVFRHIGCICQMLALRSMCKVCRVAIRHVAAMTQRRLHFLWSLCSSWLFTF